ncbi:MAG: excinuclease ABC subunit UvrA [Bacteroidia bacterium]|nr:excinuclease ABC subunit UvrA [Bacteroidia bacterium]
MSFQKQITIKNARTHNLKNVSVEIPHNKLIVITGVSGSGKTSLAYDTLYAEGHRRYIESLSSYARQFIERLPKPPVDYIKGLSPCIALEQKVSTNNPRSTVGTATEIYDYLRVLFARCGSIIHPVTGKEIKRHYPQDVVQFILTLSQKSNILIAVPIAISSKLKNELSALLQSGFSRVLINEQILKIKDAIEQLPTKIENCFLIIDRISLEKIDEEAISRITDSVETAYNQSNGICYVITQQDNEWDYHKFSNILESDGIAFEEPTPQLFAFNNPYGICPICKGTGIITDYNIQKIVKDKNKPLKNSLKINLSTSAKKLFDHLVSAFPDIFNKNLNEISPSEMSIIWNGNEHIKGLLAILHQNEKEMFYYGSEYYFSFLKSKQTCYHCNGSRLRKEALYIKINGLSIADFINLPIDELLIYFKNELSQKIPHQSSVQKLLDEITSRLEFLCDVGLPYLTLNREMRTLSGGESQRVLLTTALGSSLVGSIYVLDEPTTGLHPRDTHRLITALKKLRDEGNTVIVVEHDEEVMKNADLIIDIGPNAGEKGGQVTFIGSPAHLMNADTLTSQYLSGKRTVNVRSIKREYFDFIYLKGSTAYNLKNINIQFPFNAITCITGVSGSGKSTLIEEELIPEVEKILIHFSKSEKISGAINKIHHLHYINQNSVSTSTRSNCATYTKVYDDIRVLFAHYSKLQGFHFEPSYFSFNVPGGRCEKCYGEGILRIPMQFMADIEMTCDECNGKRFSKEVLQVTYFGASINDVLQMSVDEAYNLFSKETTFKDLKSKILKPLKILQEVGLGYIAMGQSTSKMSGGELQRLKIASFLLDEKAQPSLFILDEPSTGLHFYDIDILMKALYQLIIRGHTIIIIEHQLDIIKNADWIIELGPEGGNKGGYLVFQGTLNDFLECKESYTAEYLQEKFILKT